MHDPMGASQNTYYKERYKRVTIVPLPYKAVSFSLPRSLNHQIIQILQKLIQIENKINLDLSTAHLSSSRDRVNKYTYIFTRTGKKKKV
ncbi:hypothetical protein GDO78_004229 [Eleutherodactylus coqui]|uniref:Uncharacterized protein n=1 Tax=Eleutherodactylus coqui TaxID=57060 RepID=A0A8J6JZH3_ELECQ|nr:hypothetical protein GDO78_004229 [Eleutherodactylus coqui]